MDAACDTRVHNLAISRTGDVASKFEKDNRGLCFQPLSLV